MNSRNGIPLTVERLRELIHYDPDTGVFTNKVNRGFRGVMGNQVGSPDGKGYLCIRIDYVVYQCHRLAWLWVYKEWPKYQIDHIDGVRNNNRIKNLRDVPQTINQQNRRNHRMGSTSKIIGVRFLNGSWNARLHFHGKEWSLGSFDTSDEAYESYIGAKRLFHPGCTL